MSRPTIGIIGAGRVGATLARLWRKAGYTISVIYSRTEEHAKDLATFVDAKVVMSANEVIRCSDLTVLSVPDDAIESVVVLLAHDVSLDGEIPKAVIHTSGAHSVVSLQLLADKGMMTGGLHPIYPFADVDSALEGLIGATFALETNDTLLHKWLQDLVHTVAGQTIIIPKGQKSLYHSALVIASNYTVTLYAIAEQLLVNLGADKSIADDALNTLIRATIDNIQVQGIPDALTGPLVRTDIGTMESHLVALSAENSELQLLYKQLARLSIPMLKARDVNTTLLEEMLKQD